MKHKRIQVGKTYQNAGGGLTTRTVFAMSKDRLWLKFRQVIGGIEWTKQMETAHFAKWAGKEVDPTKPISRTNPRKSSAATPPDTSTEESGCAAKFRGLLFVAPKTKSNPTLFD